MKLEIIMLSRNFNSPHLQIFSRPRIKALVFSIVLTFLVYEFGLLTHFFERDYYTKFYYPVDIDVVDILASLKAGEKPQIEPINGYHYHFTNDNGKKCRQKSEKLFDKVTILFMVKSALHNREQRMAIRKTWGWEERFSDVSVRRVFLLGSSSDLNLQEDINEESTRFKDIVQANFEDTYYNNTIKTMMGFKWVVLHCRKVEFILFADDDMYVSTKNLLRFLRNPFNENMDYRKLLQFDSLSNVLSSGTKGPMPLSAYDGRLYAGHVFFSSPMRHRSSKWFVTLDEYPFSMYPPYVTAGAYILSFPALEDLYYISQYTKPFKFDDIFLGIVAKKCGIVPLHNDNFYFWKKAYNMYGYKYVIASHGFKDPNDLQTVWSEQRLQGHA